MLIKRAHWAFYRPKYACINLADVWTVNLLAVAYAENFHGEGSISGIWWSFVFGVCFL